MPSSKPQKGVNDLATLKPEIAKEADGWDPTTVVSRSNKRMSWKCKLRHTWIASIASRVGNVNRKGTNCPYCTNQKVLSGFNDLQTKYPEIAKEADGWDPSNVLGHSNKKLPWKCSLGHRWESKVERRSSRGDGCPYCSNRKVLTGFNDLQTKYPEIAKEADGWDPSKVGAGSNNRMPWRCALKHEWNTTILSRTQRRSGCPYCTNQKVLSGFNDLQTKYPEIAKEADGWDPLIVHNASHAKKGWKCSLGHKWKAIVKNRTQNNHGCPCCLNRKVWSGFNDLQTKYPEIAKEADGWDPSKVLAGGHQRRKWKCSKGHRYTTVINYRTISKSGCPYCSNQKLLVGFNDLQTTFPEVAKEADGWDPRKFTAGSNKKMNWKCIEGHTWATSPDERTRGQTGCPSCAEYGFNPDEPAWFYLMKREGEQQFGITNNLKKRIKQHRSKGWKEVDKTDSHSGYQIQEIERKLKKWLREEVGLIEGTTENWYTSKMEVSSLSELKKKSGIETSIF